MGNFCQENQYSMVGKNIIFDFIIVFDMGNSNIRSDEWFANYHHNFGSNFNILFVQNA